MTRRAASVGAGKLIPVFAFLALLLTAAEAHAHDPPPIHIEAELFEGEFVFEILCWEPIYDLWTGLSGKAIAQDAEAERVAHAAEIEEFVYANGPVWIDGVRVRGKLIELRHFVNVDVPYVAMKMRYKLLEAPLRVRFQWLDYRIGEDWNAEKASCFFYPEDEDEFVNLALVPKEPEYTWHRRPEAPSAESVNRLVRGESLALSTDKTLPVPIAAIGVIILTLAGVAFARHRGSSALTRGGIAVAGLVVAVAVAPYFVVEVPVGTETTEAPLPTDEESRQIFEALLQNVYRAFDYEKPEAIYDALAESVTADLLDTTYNEVYRSLILREEGGAVADVRQVQVEEADVTHPVAGEARFNVAARWLVRGVVEHFEHEHLRTNEYRADYELVRLDGRWRIANADMLSQERIGDDQALFKKR